MIREDVESSGEVRIGSDGKDSGGWSNLVVGGKDLVMFSSIVGVDGSAVPTTQHSLAPNLLAVWFR